MSSAKPGPEATLSDWLSFRGLPAGASLLTLIEHERANAALGGAFDAIRDGAPGRRSLTIGKRYFGNVRQLPSGRWQARFDAAGQQKKAPETFPTREAAQAWLDDLAEQQKPVHPGCPTCACRPEAGEHQWGVRTTYADDSQSIDWSDEDEARDFLANYAEYDAEPHMSHFRTRELVRRRILPGRIEAAESDYVARRQAADERVKAQRPKRS